MCIYSLRLFTLLLRRIELIALIFFNELLVIIVSRATHGKVLNLLSPSSFVMSFIMSHQYAQQGKEIISHFLTPYFVFSFILDLFTVQCKVKMFDLQFFQIFYTEIRNNLIILQRIRTVTKVLLSNCLERLIKEEYEFWKIRSYEKHSGRRYGLPKVFHCAVNKI